MAVLAAKASGDFTANTSWGLVAQASSSYLNAENGSEVLTAAYSDTRSSAFTPGAITIDAIGVKLSVRTGVTGTMSVHLIDSVGAIEVAGTEVVINVADLPVSATADLNGGWILFKLAAPVLLIVATAYKIEAKTSDASQVSLFRDATADNISRILRDTSNNTPAAGDDLIICGEKTGAGAETALTVTMNETAATDYGAASTSLVTPSLAICDGGTLSYGVAAATNYVLRQSGNVIVYSGGTFNIGTTGTPIPRGGSAVLEFDCAADGGFGLLVRNLGTFTAQGLSRTAAKLIDRCLLNTDEAAAQTTLGVDTDTGWLSGDDIAIASTTQTASQSEARVLDGNAGASSIAVTVGLTNAHSGTSPTQAEVILLTRNVRIRAVTSTLVTYCCFKPTSQVDIDWTEFYYLGEDAADKRAVDVQTTTGNFNMQRSSIHDCEDRCFYISGSASNNITFSNNVTFLAPSITGSAVDVSASTSGTAIAIDGNICMRPVASCFNLADTGVAITNNIAVSAGSSGYNFNESAAMTGTFSGNTAHSCNTDGLLFSTGGVGGTITNFTSWRNTGFGININTSVISSYTFNTGILFGNSTNNIRSGSTVFNLTFNDYVLNGDTAFGTTNGVLFVSNAINIRFNNCDFSTVAGIKTAHTNDFNITSGAMIQSILRNCKLGAATEVNGQSGMLANSFIKSQKHDQTAGSHKSFFKYGIIQLDAATFHTAAPSEKLTPNNASNKLESGVKKYAVASGGTVTASAWVRKDAGYTGNAPRLVLKANPAAGIAADVVLDTLSVGVDTWEKLSGTSAAVTDDAVLTVVVDADTGGDCWTDDFGT